MLEECVNVTVSTKNPNNLQRLSLNAIKDEIASYRETAEAGSEFASLTPDQWRLDEHEAFFVDLIDELICSCRTVFGDMDPDLREIRNSLIGND